jgi:sirohydrochlorin ferrochelatase
MALTTTKHVKERTKYARVRRQKNETPLQHRRFGCRPDVVHHEQQRQCGQREPQQNDAVDHCLNPFARIVSIVTECRGSDNNDRSGMSQPH